MPGTVATPAAGDRDAVPGTASRRAARNRSNHALYRHPSTPVQPRGAWHRGDACSGRSGRGAWHRRSPRSPESVEPRALSPPFDACAESWCLAPRRRLQRATGSRCLAPTAAAQAGIGRTTRSIATLRRLCGLVVPGTAATPAAGDRVAVPGTDGRRAARNRSNHALYRHPSTPVRPRGAWHRGDACSGRPGRGAWHRQPPRRQESVEPRALSPPFDACAASWCLAPRRRLQRATGSRCLAPTVAAQPGIGRTTRDIATLRRLCGVVVPGTAATPAAGAGSWCLAPRRPLQPRHASNLCNYQRRK